MGFSVEDRLSSIVNDVMLELGDFTMLDLYTVVVRRARVSLSGVASGILTSDYLSNFLREYCKGLLSARKLIEVSDEMYRLVVSLD